MGGERKRGKAIQLHLPAGITKEIEGLLQI